MSCDRKRLVPEFDQSPSSSAMAGSTPRAATGVAQSGSGENPGGSDPRPESLTRETLTRETLARESGLQGDSSPASETAAVAKIGTPDSEAHHGEGSRGADDRRPAWSQDIKNYYDKVASEPIPDSFASLMANLAQSIRK